MKQKIFLKALLNLRNIGILSLLTGSSLALDRSDLLSILGSFDIAVYPASIVVYLIFVLQSFSSKTFQDKVIAKEKTTHIKKLNKKCVELAYESKKFVNSAYYTRLKKVMENKNEIMNCYLKDNNNFLKGRVVEQTLNLLVSYLKLLINFSKRSREVATMDISLIVNRVNTNNRKLSFNPNSHVAEDLKKSIQMDERLIERLKEERIDLEKTSAKLDYMESMVSIFKQQILSSLESEDMIERLETTVSEAEALDTVLDNRRRNRCNA